jgi:hypothetical protein
MAKKKVSRTTPSRLKDEPLLFTNELASIAAPIYAAKWRENANVYAPDRLGNRELMMLALDEAKMLLKVCSE